MSRRPTARSHGKCCGRRPSSLWRVGSDVRGSERPAGNRRGRGLIRADVGGSATRLTIHVHGGERRSEQRGFADRRAASGDAEEAIAPRGELRIDPRVARRRDPSERGSTPEDVACPGRVGRWVVDLDEGAGVALEDVVRDGPPIESMESSGFPLDETPESPGWGRATHRKPSRRNGNLGVVGRRQPSHAVPRKKVLLRSVVWRRAP
jgi:hypothetical protein